MSCGLNAQGLRGDYQSVIIGLHEKGQIEGVLFRRVMMISDSRSSFFVAYETWNYMRELLCAVVLGMDNMFYFFYR